jgi:transposase
MDTLHHKCAGLDVHKKSVVACVRTQRGRKVDHDIRTFGTTTDELIELFDWLASFDVEEVVMESTGVYWRPIWKVLGCGFELHLANAKEVKNVPGRKSDVKDAQWLAELMAHGMLRPSFVPDQDQQELRELTRTARQLARERARHKQRIQKHLEACNIKLANVITNILGKSGRKIIEAIIEGKIIDPIELADLSEGSIYRNKWLALAKSLRGTIRPHDRFMLASELRMHDAMQAELDRIRARIDEVLPDPFVEAVGWLSAIPGFSPPLVIEVLAQTGVDMSRFPTADHLVSWACLCPRSDSTAGKPRSTRTRQGSQWLKPILIQVAWSAVNKKDSRLRAYFQRLKSKCGPQKAIVATAAKILRIIYALLRDGVVYEEKVAEEKLLEQEKRQRRRFANLERAAKRLGYQVVPIPDAA